MEVESTGRVTMKLKRSFTIHLFQGEMRIQGDEKILLYIYKKNAYIVMELFYNLTKKLRSQADNVVEVFRRREWVNGKNFFGKLGTGNIHDDAILGEG